MNLEKLTKESISIVREAGAFIRDHLGQVDGRQIEAKALNSLVSFVDRGAEERLVAGLGALLPGAAFLTEEDTVDNQEGDLRWIIDPLDGTTNFLHQLPCFSVSIALEKSGQLVLGIVYEINRDECFSAWQNGGAFLNGQPIKVSRPARLADALVATGFPYHDYDWIQPYFQVLEVFMRGTRGIRRFGSAAVDLAYVACGRFDAFFEARLNPWDVAGGAVLVREAGGIVTDFLGEDNFLFGGEIIASSPDIAGAVLQPVRRAFH